MKQILTLLTLLVFPLIGFCQEFDESTFPVLSGEYLGQTTPGDTAVIFAPGIVSTGNQHGSAYFTPEAKELVFSWTNFDDPPKIMHMKEVNGKWSIPVILVDKTLTPCFSPDGNELYVSTERRLAKMTRTTSGWSDPIDLGNSINFGQRQDFPSISSDGTLYYSTMYQNNGIVYAKKSSTGFAAPEWFKINGENIMGMPFIAPDESYIIFSSFEFGSMGKSDLFICYTKSDGSLTKPVNLGPQINSRMQDRHPTISFDGKYMFFMSDRPSQHFVRGEGAGNVYWVKADFIGRLRP